MLRTTLVRPVYVHAVNLKNTNLDLNGSGEYGSYRVQKTPPSFKQIPNGNFDAEIVAQRFSPNFQRVRRFAKEGRTENSGHPDEF
ncbi:hypothetical protein JTE90_013841 [Oedothorax gibbosus]|uniref:Uncharacterized protein n=1 Tax=Oedothorax gibbosus TaxID=931172 RepID=A0AAV6TKA5_9ARAC|nr:hypothetical protein JTE90_013841 [Oedothorax gibbosus]